MPVFDPASLVSRFLLATALALSGFHVNAAEPAWPDGSYTYYADHKPVAAVLKDFCTTFGLSLHISPKVSAAVDGRVTASSPADFLDRLAARNGLTWFRHGGSLYVARIDEGTSRQFQVSASGLPAVRAALTQMAVLNPKFGWSELPGQGTVVVSGPDPYVRLVADAMGRLAPSANDLQVAVIKLRFARVDDRTVQERDRQVVIPGVATLLRNLISGMRAASAQAERTGPGLTPLESIGGDSQDSRRPSAAMPSNAATIQADVRTNAIIVRDSPSMIPTYEQIIHQLDVPTSLVQIEAMIVDISKDHLKDLGVDWTARAGKLAAGFGDPSAAATQGALSLSLGSNSVVGQVQQLLARIRALEQKGDAKVLSKPMILTTDNLTALIDLSETFYTRVSGEHTASLVPVTAGVMLKVTPHIVGGQDGMPPDIQMTVDIEDGTLDSRSGVDLPVVNKSTISTQAVIKGQQSLLIGGFNSQRNESSEQRVPVLGSLPIVGALFRNKSTVDSTTERLFLITPTVVDAVASVPAIAPEVMPVPAMRVGMPAPLVAMRQVDSRVATPLQNVQQMDQRTSSSPAVAARPASTMTATAPSTLPTVSSPQKFQLPQPTPKPQSLPTQQLHPQSLATARAYAVAIEPSPEAMEALSLQRPSVIPSARAGRAQADAGREARAAAAPDVSSCDARSEALAICSRATR